MAQHPTSTILCARRGFTLVEIIVSLAIFAIVCVVALAALVKIIDANKRAQSVQNAVTNVSFVLDSMSRELRAGSAYYCDWSANDPSLPLTANIPGTPTCMNTNGSGGVSNNASGVVIAFLSSRTASDNGGCRLAVAYKITSDRLSAPGNPLWDLSKAQQTSCGESTASFTASYSPLIDATLTSITGYFLQISQPPSGGYPLALVGFTGYAGAKETTKTYFTVQASAAARVP